MRFYKNMHFPFGKSLFLRFRALKRSADSRNNWWNDALKIHWKFLCFSPSILSKIWQNSTKNKVSTSISKKIPKISIFQPFWPPKTLPKSTQNAFKIDVQKNMHFFIDFCSNLVACCKSQHQKNVRPRSVLLAFHTIQRFACCMHFWCKKSTKHLPITTSEPYKNQCKKRIVL